MYCRFVMSLPQLTLEAKTGNIIVKESFLNPSTVITSAHSHQGQLDQDPSSSKAPGNVNIDENLAISENLIMALEKRE